MTNTNCPNAASGVARQQVWHLLRPALLGAVMLLAMIVMLIAPARAQSTDARDFVGTWVSPENVNGWIFFSINIQPTGDPVKILRATGFATRDRLTENTYSTVPAADAWAAGMMEGIVKGNTKPVDIELAVVNGGYQGVDTFSGATFRFAQSTDARFGKLAINVSAPRADGTTENHVFPNLTALPERMFSGSYHGQWTGEVAGLVIEADIKAAGAEALAVQFRYFPDGNGEVPGQVAGGLGEVALKDRPFEMISPMRILPGRGANSAFGGMVNHPPDEWQIDHAHAATLRRIGNGLLELSLARTRDDLIGNRTEKVFLRPLDVTLRDVPPIPSPFENMSGRWTGTLGPLTVELDIVVPVDGALKGEVRHFHETNQKFPADVSAGLIIADEIAMKTRPFAAFLAGSGQRQPPAIMGRLETDDQGDINWTSMFRLRKSGDDLLLDYAKSEFEDAFTGPSIILVKMNGALREVASPLPPAPRSGLAGLWTWRSGASGGHEMFLDIDDIKGGVMGRLLSTNLDGTCEAFARTQNLCELAKASGPINTPIRLDETGDPRWTHMGTHGVRAFGGSLPAYTDLRLRAMLTAQGEQLAVQMTAGDAFQGASGNTYLFERVKDQNKLNLAAGEEFNTRAYLAKESDSFEGGACESWAKQDSLQRQKNDPALTTQLDAILAKQSLSVSGHPMDRQCKAMLDEIAALGATKNDPSPAPVIPGGQTAIEGELWRGSYWVVGRGGMGDGIRKWDDLARAERVSDALEAHVSFADNALFVFSTNVDGGFSFADERPAFSYASRNAEGKPSTGFTKVGSTYSDSFDALMAEVSRGRLTDAAANLRLPYPDGATPSDFVGSDAVLWREGRYRLAYASADRNRLFIYDEASFGVHRFLLLEKAEDAPRLQPETSGAGVAGWWTRVGQPHYSVPSMNGWTSFDPAPGTSNSFEISGDPSAYVLTIDGKKVGALDKADFGIEALSPHLNQPSPDTAGLAVKDWVGSGATLLWSFQGGGDTLLLGPDAAPSEKTVLLALGSKRAAVIVGRRDGDGLSGLEIGLAAPPLLYVVPFERSGTPDRPVNNNQLPKPDQEGDPTGGSLKDQKAGLDRNATCLALEKRREDVYAATGGGTAVVQMIRSIYSDVGLAFGGEETEAKCQRALDQLAGLALMVPEQGRGGTTQNVNTTVNTTVNNSTTILNNVVGNLTNFSDSGGSFNAPDAPDPCGPLATISNGLSFSGGVELSGVLSDVFLSVGFSSVSRASPDQCYNALHVLDDLGLDPADADGMSLVVNLINRLAPPQAAPDGRIQVMPGRSVSRACEAYYTMRDQLGDKGVPALGDYLSATDAEVGEASGHNGTPSSDACARALREFADLGLDASKPDGGWAQAQVVLYGPTPVNDNLQPSVGYDPRPETREEAVEWRDEYRYIFPFPQLAGVFDGVNPSNLTVFIVPGATDGAAARTDSDLSGDGLLGAYSAEGESQSCTETEHVLTAREAFRVFAMVKQLTQEIGIPTAIRTGRRCLLVQAATTGLFATGNGPALGNGAPVLILDRRLDGQHLDDAERDAARQAIETMIGQLGAEEPGSWHMLMTTPQVAEAFIRDKVSPRSAIVYDRTSRKVIVDFTVHLGHGE